MFPLHDAFHHHKPRNFAIGRTAA